jgi:hypothetical protein
MVTNLLFNLGQMLGESSHDLMKVKSGRGGVTVIHTSGGVKVAFPMIGFKETPVM